MDKPVVVSVEDDPVLYDLIKLTLKALPIELHNASTGSEALRIIPELKPDLIILDINLPDMRGWNILENLKKEDHLLKQVIVLTTHTDATHRVIARLQEVTAYVSKPFEPHKLRKLVSETLQMDGQN